MKSIQKSVIFILIFAIGIVVLCLFAFPNTIRFSHTIVGLSWLIMVFCLNILSQLKKLNEKL